MRKNLLSLSLLALAAVANAQAYRGWVGITRYEPVEIKIENAFTGVFSGWIEMAPTIRIPIRGRVVNGKFTINQWMSFSPVRRENSKIIGPGVELYRKI